MTCNTLQSAQGRADRNSQRLLGKALLRLKPYAPDERIPDDLMELLAEADRRRRAEQN
jgi:hypothetical protein